MGGSFSGTRRAASRRVRQVFRLRERCIVGENLVQLGVKLAHVLYLGVLNQTMTMLLGRGCARRKGFCKN